MTHRTELQYNDAVLSDHARKILNAHIRSRKKWPSLIVMAGNVGTGKTYDACALAMHVIKHKGWLRFACCSMIHEYDPARKSECHRCTALILDDYGARQTDGALAQAFQLVKSREHLQKSVTIITTNLTKEVADIDPRISSRMNEACIISYAGLPDRRLNRTI